MTSPLIKPKKRTEKELIRWLKRELKLADVEYKKWERWKKRWKKVIDRC